jgi:hypothetical protein
MFGNTRAVAAAIADGIAAHMPVETLEVAAAPVALPDDVALLVVGGPTHAHGMTTPRTRTDAGERAGERLVSRGQGMREWLRVSVRSRSRRGGVRHRIKGPGCSGAGRQGAAKALAAAGFRQRRPVAATGRPAMFDRLLAGRLDRRGGGGASPLPGGAGARPVAPGSPHARDHRRRDGDDGRVRAPNGNVPGGLKRESAGRYATARPFTPSRVGRWMLTTRADERLGLPSCEPTRRWARSATEAARTAPAPTSDLATRIAALPSTPRSPRATAKAKAKEPSR